MIYKHCLPITNESREAAPRLRHHSVFRTRTHTRASSESLPKISAGITNPCACIKQPARALALGTDRPAHAGQRNNHYGCPTIRKAGPRDPVVKAKACALSTAAWRLKRGAADGGGSEAPPRADSDGGGSEAAPMAAEARRRRWLPKQGGADGCGGEASPRGGGSAALPIAAAWRRKSSAAGGGGSAAPPIVAAPPMASDRRCVSTEAPPRGKCEIQSNLLKL
jgi:hypothetical protein